MKTFLSTLLLAGSITVSAQEKEDSLQFAKISTEILNKGKAYNELKDLSTTELVAQRMDKYSKMGEFKE